MAQKEKLKGLLDSHIHLAHIKNLDEFLQCCTDFGIKLAAASISKPDRLHLETHLSQLDISPIVCVGQGLHPWFIDEKCKLDFDFDAKPKLISEIGLDKLKAKSATAYARQIELFEDLLDAYDTPTAIFSIHAVKAAKDVLDIYEKKQRQGLYILHWFSGTSEDLTRARKLDFYFSVNHRMLQTKRGKEYVRQIPASKLLLESDWPKHAVYPETEYVLASDYIKELEEIVSKLSEIKQIDMYAQLLKNQTILFNLLHSN